MDELYEVLGVSKNATSKEIKKAYKDKSKIHHPDKESGNEELFKKIQEAYAILIDPLSRKMYDITGDVKETSFDKGMQNLFDSYIIPELIKLEKNSFERVDIIKLIDALIFDKVYELKDKIHKNKEVKNRLELILFRKRKKNTESEDILAKVFEPHIKQSEMSVLMFEAELECVEKIRELVSEYEYNMAEYMSQNILGNGV